MQQRAGVIGLRNIFSSTTALGGPGSIRPSPMVRQGSRKTGRVRLVRLTLASSAFNSVMRVFYTENRNAPNGYRVKALCFIKSTMIENH